MTDALSRFRSLCSLISDPSLRLMFEEWAVLNVKELCVEVRIDDGDMFSGALRHAQTKSLEAIVRGVAQSACETTTEEWMQGDHKLGTILKRRIRVLG